ncbi:MAG: hypothetical protein Q7S57_04135 [bacterium]|nr:hypothetical protein [bacterium]
MTTPLFQHAELAAGRWFTMTIAEQLGNIGSDYERALRWKEKGEEKMFTSAFNRTLELIDLTLNDPRLTMERKREIARMRDEVRRELLDKEQNSTSSQGLKRYFLNMALLARDAK